VERDALEMDGTVVMRARSGSTLDSIFEYIALDCMHAFADTITTFGGQWTPLGKWLVETSRVILYFNWDSMGEWTVDQIIQLLNAGARVIITKEGELPRELMAFDPPSAPPSRFAEDEPKMN
jgi:hypothetical protein